MSIVMMVYTGDALKEFVLPALDNSDYPVTLDKNMFHMKENVNLWLEVMKGEWRFHESLEYELKKEGESYFNKTIKSGDVAELVTASGETLSVIILEKKNSFVPFQKYEISGLNEITVGKNESCYIQYDFLHLVSRNHALFKRRGEDMVIEDVSRNGIFFQAKRISKEKVLSFGDCIEIFGLHIVYLGDIFAIGATSGTVHVNDIILRPYQEKKDEVTREKENQKEKEILKEKAQKKYFNRSPRNLPAIESEPIEIESPPNKRFTKEKPLFLTIGPAFTMAIPMMLGCLLSVYSTQISGAQSNAYMYTGLLTSVSSAVIGVVWGFLNIKYTRKEEREDEEQRFEAYGDYLLKIADETKKKYEANAKALIDTYPSAKEVTSYSDETSVLWNRNFTHDDFLFTRLGIGEILFQAPISIQKQRFSLVPDQLANEPEKIKEEYSMLHDVPVGIDLMKKRLIGIVGGINKSGAMAILYDMAAQIAANNCYTDVKMAFIYEEKTDANRQKWEFAKWLPHVWSEDKKTRFVASNKLEASDVFFALANLIRVRAENAENKHHAVKPHYVIFVENPALLEGEPIAKYIFEQNPIYGVTTILLVEKYEELPNACENIIQNDTYFTGMYNAMDQKQEKQEIVFDSVLPEELEGFARRLSKIHVNEIESSGEMPSSLDFFEMYGVSRLSEFHVMDRWRKNRTYESMRSLIGKKAGDKDCFLDIHEKYHGPHGLIAGTTGSGKSETLQTYMLSLAINFSPDDIGFFIIDFKGGGMANLFSNLPHMIGQISNLSGNQVHRAMISIKSENMRRQRIFSEHGVNNINLYTRLVKNNEASIPIPHLFIIIDEFAELKREEPDFMKELISVAQVGRSLGVHLILATQKPSGTVDDNIWSNTKFRLCLRVQDRQDSNDMLHKPDAAYITRAGQCYLQVGNDEIYELFQSGWSGAIYDETAAASSGAIATMLTLNGKAAIVGNRLKLKKKEEAKIAWISALITCLKKTVENVGESIEEAKEDLKLLSDMAKKMFQYMQQMNLDYGDSKYNMLRLEDFIRMWPEDEDITALTKEKKHQIAEQMISHAGREGKKLPEQREKTQLDAVVEYLGKVAKENGYTHNLQLWLPVLKDRIFLDELEGYTKTSFSNGAYVNREEGWTLEAYIGLYDDPVNQSQQPLIVNLAENGHHAVCGTVVSGKSTFLQTLLYSFITRYSPEHINIYALDFSSRMLAAFEGAAHVGGIMYENDVEKIAKFFRMMDTILEERKLLFQGGNYSQYVKVHGITVPSIVIAIDNYANFREKTENEYEDILIKLSRDGVGYGIFLVIASAGFGTSEIQSRIGDNIRTVICLEMGDKFKYMDALRTMHLDVLPEADVRGRGLAQVNGNILEFQTALAIEAEDDYKRSERITEKCKEISHAYKGRSARRIPEIPEQPVLSEFSELDDYKECIKNNRLLPYAYSMDDASIYSVDLSDTYCYFISGKARTGKTNLLKVMMHAAKEKQAELVVIDNKNGDLKKAAQEVEAGYLSTDLEIFNYFKDLTPRFVARNKFKHSLMEEGLEEVEIFEQMQKEQQIFIFIADLVSFVERIYAPEEGVGAMSGFMENITEKGRLHNIFFIGIMNTDETVRVQAERLYLNFTAYKTGVHLGGNIGAQRIFTFSDIPFMEQSKSLKPGIGLTPSKNDDTESLKVVIPLARG